MTNLSKKKYAKLPRTLRSKCTIGASCLLLAMVLWQAMIGRDELSADVKERQMADGEIQFSSAVASDADSSSNFRIPTLNLEYRPLTSEEAVVPSPAFNSPLKIIGQIRLEDSRDAVGVNVLVYPVRKDHESHLSADQFRGQTNHAGEFELEVNSHHGEQMILLASLAGYVEERAVVPAPDGRDAVDLGEFVLTVAGMVEGNLKARDGNPVFGEWMITTESNHASGPYFLTERTFSSSVEKGSGRFEFTGLPPGKVKLYAKNAMAGWIEGPVADVRAGEIARVEFFYDGPDLSKAMTFSTGDSNVPCDMALDANEVALIGPSGVRFPPSAFVACRFTFANLDVEARYSLEVRAKAYRNVLLEGLAPGKAYDLELIGNARVSLKVEDRDSSLPVIPLRVSVEYADAKGKWWPLDPAANQEGDWECTGIAARDVCLLVECEGYVPSELKLGVLAPGELRSALASVSRGAKLGGRVIDAFGNGIGSASVMLRPGIDPSTSADIVEIVLIRVEAGSQVGSCRQVETDADGAFCFYGIAPGPYEVECSAGKYVNQRSYVIVAAEASAFVELAMRPPGFLCGILQGLGRSFEVGPMLLVSVADETPLSVMLDKYIGRQGCGPWLVGLDDNGSFSIGPIAEGAYRLALWMSSRAENFIGRDMASEAGLQIPLGEVTVREGCKTIFEANVQHCLPGTLRLRFRDDLGFEGAEVEVHIRLRQELVGEFTAHQRLGEELVLGPVFPGEWELDAWCDDLSWFFAVPQRVGVISRTETIVELPYESVERAVEIVGAATGAPLGNTEFVIELSSWRNKRVKSDANGRIRMRLPPGEYRLWNARDFDAADDESDAEDCRISWSKNAPQPIVVRLHETSASGGR